MHVLFVRLILDNPCLKSFVVCDSQRRGNLKLYLTPESNFCDTFEWKARIDFKHHSVSVKQFAKKCLELMMSVVYHFVFDIHMCDSKSIVSLP